MCLPIENLIYARLTKNILQCTKIGIKLTHINGLVDE